MVDINVNKDETQIAATAQALDQIADLRLLKRDLMLDLAEALMHHLQVYKKK